MDNLHIPEQVYKYVRAGVITVDFHVTADGIDSWARCTQPHPRLGITTSQSMTFDEVPILLSKVRVQSDKVPTTPPRSPLSQRAPQGRLPVPSTRSEAIDLIRSNHLDKWNRGGVQNQLPVDSLHISDLALDDFSLGVRLAYVATGQDSAKLVHRITSDTSLRVPQATNLKEWWQKASGDQIWRLLTVNRKSGWALESTIFKKRKVPYERLCRFRCPFLNPSTPMDIEEVEEDFSTLSLSRFRSEEESEGEGVSF